MKGTETTDRSSSQIRDHGVWRSLWGVAGLGWGHRSWGGPQPQVGHSGYQGRISIHSDEG